MLLFPAEVFWAQKGCGQGIGVLAWIFLCKLQALFCFVIMKQCFKCHQSRVQLILLGLLIGSQDQTLQRWRGLEQSREYGKLLKNASEKEMHCGNEPWEC